MWKIDNVLMIAASFLLLLVNWLAFHDLREVHAVRDWLMLLASILALIEFARILWNSNLRQR
jgi:hypothetical protein